MPAPWATAETKPAAKAVSTVTPTPTAIVASAWDEIPEEFVEGQPGRFPSLVIVQKAVASIPDSESNGGKFWRSDLEKFVAAPEGVFVYYQKTRSLFEENGPRFPLCASDDTFAPLPAQPLWSREKAEVDLKGLGTVGVPSTKQPEQCGYCPFMGNGCKQSFVAYLVDDDGYLLRMRFKGTGFMPFADFLKPFRPKALKVGGGASGARPIFSKRVRLHTEKVVDGPDRLWYEPRIEVVGDVDPAAAGELINIAREVRSRIASGAEMVHESDEDAPAKPQWQTDAQFDGDADDVPLQ